MARFNAVVGLAETAAFITRSPDLQREALLATHHGVDELAGIRRACQLEERCDEANAALALICLLRALAAEIDMWRLLRSFKPEEAWDRLAEAQDFCRAAARAHDCGIVGCRRLSHLESLEREVFPPQVFQSIGFTSRRQLCSICGRDYNACNHLEGLAYCGGFCNLLVEGLELKEVSIVLEPADKRCRVVRFVDGGKWRNRMTWKLEDAKPGQRIDERTVEGIVARVMDYEPIVP